MERVKFNEFRSRMMRPNYVYSMAVGIIGWHRTEPTSTLERSATTRADNAQAEMETIICEWADAIQAELK